MSGLTKGFGQEASRAPDPFYSYAPIDISDAPAGAKCFKITKMRGFDLWAVEVLDLTSTYERDESLDASPIQNWERDESFGLRERLTGDDVLRLAAPYASERLGKLNEYMGKSPYYRVAPLQQPQRPAMTETTRAPAVSFA